MRTVPLAVGLMCGCLAFFAEASQFRFGGLAIDVPTKFEGPVTAQPDERARTYAFTVRTASPLLPSTVLKITVYDTAADVQAGSSADISKRYLLRRSDYDAGSFGANSTYRNLVDVCGPGLRRNFVVDLRATCQQSRDNCADKHSVVPMGDLRTNNLGQGMELVIRHVV